MGLSVDEVAADLGKNRATVYRYESNYIENMPIAVLEPLAKVLHTSPEYLMGWDDIKITAHMHEALQGNVRVLGNSTLTPTGHRIGRAYEKATPPVQRTVEVALEPYLETEAADDSVIQIDFRNSDQAASAGTGVFLNDESMDTIHVRLDALPRGYERAPERYFGVPVAGDSMEPHFHDGDILIVSQEPVDVGDIGVFTMNGEGYVKKLGRGVLHSLNPEYEDLPLEEDVRCNGKVVGVLKSEDIES